MNITVKSNIGELTKSLTDLQKKQIPFAAARALSSIAKRLVIIEKKNIKDVFPTATPFTVGGVWCKQATKADLTAIIDVKDITAKYLAPFEVGGHHDLGTKQGLLTPIAQAVNQYGNIPPNTLARLKSRKDVFIGTPKGGTINGVWQRPFLREQQRDVSDSAKIRKKLRGRHSGKGGGLNFTFLESVYRPDGKKKFLRPSVRANVSGKLILLIKFSDSKEVTQKLNWMSMAEGCVNARWEREFDKAMKNALATAK